PDHRRLPADRPVRADAGALGDARLRCARRQAGVLWGLPARRGDGAAGRGLALARPQARPDGAAVMSALLEVQGVGKRFRGLLAVDNVSFTIAERDIFAVIGP